VVLILANNLMYIFSSGFSAEKNFAADMAQARLFLADKN